jgi:predicted O-methyltransferase YrrM
MGRTFSFDAAVGDRLVAGLGSGPFSQLSGAGASHDAIGSSQLPVMASPKAFPDLITLLKTRYFPPPELRSIYALYSRMRRAKGFWLEVEEFGARSHGGRNRLTTLGRLTRRAATPPLKGTYLYLFVRAQKPQRLLELGTHLGIGTLYLHAAVPTAEIHTIEASPTLATYAQRHFALLGASIKGHIGRFADVLPTLSGPWDLIYIDGDHRGSALEAYITQLYPALRDGGWFVCDDIYWSWDMWRSWKKVRQGGWRRTYASYPFGFLQK